MPAEMRLRAQRIVLFGIGFFVALLATFHVIRTELDAAEIEPLATRHGVATYYRNQINTFRNLGLKPGTVRIAFLADSMAVSYPARLVVPVQLQMKVARQIRGDPPVRIFNLALAGTGPFDYYLLADLLAEAEPDLAVISFEMASPGEAFRKAFSRPELAGWVEGPRIFETAFLPMHWIGLTLDKLLFYRAIIRSGGVEPWVALTRELTRVGVARGMIENRLAIVGPQGKTAEDIHEGRSLFYALERNNQGFNRRYSKHGMRANLGAVLSGIRPDNPTLLVLGATIRAFARKDISSLVYLNPINIEHIESLELLDEKALARSVRSIRSVVESNGGSFLNLLRIFPDELFRDHAGHFVYQDGVNGPGKLAAYLAPTIVRLARQEARRKQ